MEQQHIGRKIFPYLPLLLAVILSGMAHSEIIRQEMDQGLIATAEYREGDVQQPAVLIQHGFLQTREFLTVRRLADTLHDVGYTILLPNLTLGINARVGSLSCEAVHTHSMEQDIAELSRWVDWLSRKTDRKIVLIGHSTANLQITAYLNKYPPPPKLASVIFISLIPYGLGPSIEEIAAEKLLARQTLLTDPDTLREYRLVYCRRYPTTPDRYLSYIDWDQHKTLEGIRRIDLPVTVIFGGRDRRIVPAWRESLKKLPLQEIEIADADHFFDRQYEFPLCDAIEAVLNDLRG